MSFKQENDKYASPNGGSDNHANGKYKVCIEQPINPEYLRSLPKSYMVSVQKGPMYSTRVDWSSKTVGGLKSHESLQLSKSKENITYTNGWDSCHYVRKKD
uniref:Uncharacterized protein n=1 Tax=Drosophila-associated filamentous virus TaxID=2743186 RepID=A0A6M9TZY2_9VIRU|nr:putative protein 14 [Drosophila-associated filamentous virus]